MKKFLVLVILFFLVSACYAGNATFISIADIHFNPFANCHAKDVCPTARRLVSADVRQWQTILSDDNKTQSIADYDYDTNFPLLQSMLDETKKIAGENNSKFIIILGDFIAHDFYQKFVTYTRIKNKIVYQNFIKKIFEFLNLEFQSAYNKIPILFVVGNNDSYTGNYKVNVNGKMFSDLAQLWKPSLNPLQSANFMRDLKNNGAYQVSLSNKNSLIVMNSVLFTSHDKKNQYTLAANAELKWLEKILVETQKQQGHIIIAMHIPPGTNNYAALIGSPKEFWKAAFSQKFANLLDEYQNTITAVLAGHIHFDRMGVVNFSHPDPIVVDYTGSISPVFGNDPTFKLYTYDEENLKFLKYESYRLALTSSYPRWKKEFHFSNSF